MYALADHAGAFFLQDHVKNAWKIPAVRAKLQNKTRQHSMFSAHATDKLENTQTISQNRRPRAKCLGYPRAHDYCLAVSNDWQDKDDLVQ